MLGIFFLFFGALSPFYGIYLLLAELRFRKTFAREAAKKFNYEPSVSVIAPTRGPEPGLERNIRALLSQDYPRNKAEYIFVLDAKEDPAYGMIRKLSRGKNVRIRVSKPLPRCSGKISALLTGLEEAKKEVFVFADTDGFPRRNWLRTLAGRLGEAGIASGFRFYLPGKGIVSHLRCSWNNIAMSQIFSLHLPFPWGGSLAIRKKDFHRFPIVREWKKSVSDDVVFAKYTQDKSLRLRYSPLSIVFGDGKTSFRGLVEFSNRQFILLRCHLPKLNALALFGIGGVPFFTLLGLASALLGYYAAAGLLLSVIPLYVMREYIRLRGYRRNIGIKGSAAKYALAGYFAAWLFSWNTLQALFRNRITWRGRTYVIHSPENIEVISSVEMLKEKPRGEHNIKRSLI